MRKKATVSLSLALAALAVLSCTKEVENNPIETISPASGGITIHVLSGGDATRTMAVDGDIPTIQWVNTDKVKVFEVVDGVQQGFAESAEAVIDSEGRASFSTTLDWDDAGGSAYQYSAVYPSEAVVYSESQFYLRIPAEQALVGNNFSEDSDILFSTPLDHGASRAADGENVLFSFRRLGTVVRLRLNGISAGEKIRRVTLKAPTPIAGTIIYDPVTSTVDPRSIYGAESSDTVVLTVDDVVATGDDVVWFRVLCDSDWAAGEAFNLEVITDKNVYQKEVTLPYDIKFPDGGVTKFGVGLKAKPLSLPCAWDFESGADGWTFIDSDGDGFNWFPCDDDYANDVTWTGDYDDDDDVEYGHSGTHYLASQSYDSAYDGLHPDNWAFTPPVQLAEDNYVSFWVRPLAPNFPNEHFAVYLTLESPDGTPVGLMPETVYPSVDCVDRNGYWQRFMVRIPEEYNHEIVCIGFRHFNCYDQFWLLIDDVEIAQGEPVLPDYIYYEDFENGDVRDWTFIDANGDGYNWELPDDPDYNALSGSHILTSASFINGEGAPVEPDNWAFTPPIKLTSDNYLSFWMCAQDPNWPEEHFAAYIIDSPPTSDNLDDCTVLVEETQMDGNGYHQYIAKIPSEFDGKIVYIGFRHFNCCDQFQLNLDDVSVTKGDPS